MSGQERVRRLKDAASRCDVTRLVSAVAARRTRLRPIEFLDEIYDRDGRRGRAAGRSHRDDARTHSRMQGVYRGMALASRRRSFWHRSRDFIIRRQASPRSSAFLKARFRSAGASRHSALSVSGVGELRRAVLRAARARSAGARSARRSRDGPCPVSRTPHSLQLDGVRAGSWPARLDSRSVRAAERRRLVAPRAGC